MSKVIFTTEEKNEFREGVPDDVPSDLPRDLPRDLPNDLPKNVRRSIGADSNDLGLSTMRDRIFGRPALRVIVGA